MNLHKIEKFYCMGLSGFASANIFSSVCEIDLYDKGKKFFSEVFDTRSLHLVLGRVRCLSREIYFKQTNDHRIYMNFIYSLQIYFKNKTCA